ncbi:hypothetical protein THAOC_07556 [Thalassiosira oceanica]|uniref:UBR-type domain-containing protein n=1 Tax=Thalassiosira oceanica TaxID=159749 RepID=K0SX86_THAOC|nr:hypothetical protein THAOC_07556 [Thalassiosira oceanica]|eukprot:EJK71038.1 hypothetical protein THAOC_07556 [Thalassiosira oceanica]
MSFCTSAITGTDHPAHQPIYVCTACVPPSPDELPPCVCEACANIIGDHHDVDFVGVGPCTCDCPSLVEGVSSTTSWRGTAGSVRQVDGGGRAAGTVVSEAAEPSPPAASTAVGASACRRSRGVRIPDIHDIGPDRARLRAAGPTSDNSGGAHEGVSARLS